MNVDNLSKVAARVSPALLLVYAGARYLDGRDGEYGPGLFWSVGHSSFLLAFIGFGILTATLWTRARQKRPIMAHVAAVASGVGVLLFCWVILTDLIEALDRRASLPDLVMNLGPVAFIAGFVGLLALAATVSHRAMLKASPVLALVAFVLVGADLDLLVVATLLLGLALWPHSLHDEVTPA